MGGNKNRGQNLVYPTKKNIREIELTQIGFNALIPNVTIVLTENSMNSTVIQKIIDENRPNYYHKFVILNPYIYTKSYILKAILEFVQPFTIHPVHYNETRESVYFLAKNCLKAVMKIISNKFCIPHTDRQFKLAIFVNCMLPEDVPVVDTFQNISVVLNKLYNPITGGLNLSNFSNNPELINYCPLFDEKIFEQVMKQAAKLTIKEIDLSKNFIKKLYGIEVLKDTLEILDISSNDLDVISCLLALKRFTKLKVLNLTDNPLCENYNSLNYVKDVKKYCPNLQTLDGVNIIIPKFVKNFLCVPDAKYLATQFLEHFFSVYDSPNRINLVHLYDVHAMFSVTANIIPNQSNSMNVKLGHYGINNPYAVYGIGEVMKLFQEFPRSYHDPYPMVCDVTLYTDTNAQIIVTGIFREYMQILSFSRSFYFSRLDDQFRIINEQLHVSNALDFQLGWSFTFPVDFQYTGNPLPFFKDQFKHFEEAMQKLTNMNLEYCQKYLVYCNYDLKKALSLFSELHVNNGVPKEAFEIRKPKSSNSSDIDICETLQKKVLQSHDSVSLKTIWTTLNRGRIENTYDPQITIDKSIHRMYRKPNVPVCFEDYPVALESTNLTQQDFRNSFQTFVSNEEKLKRSFKSFLERELEANQKSKNVKPISMVLPQPYKPLVAVINPLKETLPISKSSESNPLLNLANKMARNKAIVLNQLEKSKKSEQNFCTPQSFPTQHSTASSSKQPSTSSGRTLQPRPTAAAFFNTQPTFSNPQPGPSKYIPESIPRVTKPINIPISPKKNIFSQSANTKPVDNLASTSTNKTENNVPATKPLTIDTISKLRENLQKEKQRLQNLKTNLNTSNKKIVKKSKEDPQTIVSNTIKQTDKSKNKPHTLQSNLDPEKSKKVEQKEKSTINEKMNIDESCPSKNILKSRKKSTSKDNESAKKITSDKESDTNKIIVDVESIEESCPSKTILKSGKKSTSEDNESAKKITTDKESDTNKIIVDVESVEESCPSKTILKSGKKSTSKDNESAKKITTDKESDTNKIIVDVESIEESCPSKTILKSGKKSTSKDNESAKKITTDKESDTNKIIVDVESIEKSSNSKNEMTVKNKQIDDNVSNPKNETKLEENKINRKSVPSEMTDEKNNDETVSSHEIKTTIEGNEMITKNIANETTPDFGKTSLNEKITNDQEVTSLIAEDKKTSDQLLSVESSLSPEKEKIEVEETTIGPKNVYVDNQNHSTDIIMEHTKGITEENQTVPCETISNIETKTIIEETSHQEVCQNYTNVKTEQQIVNKEVVATTQIDNNAAGKTAKQYPDLSRNLIVRLYNLSHAELEEMVTRTPFYVETPASDKIDQILEQSPGKSTNIKDDENDTNSGKVKIRMNTTLENTLETTNQSTEESILDGSVVTNSPRKEADEKLLDIMEKRKPLAVPQNKVNLKLLKISDTESKVDSHSDVNIRSLDDHNQTKSQKTEQLQVDSGVTEKIAVVKKDTFKMKNLVVRLSRIIADKDNIMKESPTSDEDNIEIIARNIKKGIQVTNRQSTEVKGVKRKPDQEATNLEPAKVKPKIENKQSISRAIKKEIKITNRQSIEVESGKRKTDQEATKLKPVKRKPKIEDEQLISKNIKKETQVADSQSIEVESGKIKTDQEATKLKPVKRKPKIEDEQLINKNIKKEIQVADSQSIKVESGKIKADQEATKLESVKRKPKIEDDQFISKNIKKEIQVADSQSIKVESGKRKTDQEATKLKPVKRKPKVEDEQLINKNIKKEIQVADSQSIEVESGKIKTDQEGSKLEPVKRKPKIEDEQLISKNIKKQTQVADSQSNKINVDDAKTEAKQKVKKLEPITRKQNIEKNDTKSTEVVLKLDEQDDEDDDDLHLSFWNMGSDDDD